jgi:hypothetical protein
MTLSDFGNPVPTIDCWRDNGRVARFPCGEMKPLMNTNGRELTRRGTGGITGASSQDYDSSAFRRDSRPFAFIRGFPISFASRRKLGPFGTLS